MDFQWKSEDIRLLVESLQLPEFWSSSGRLTFRLVQQVINLIEESDLEIQERLPEVLAVLGHPPLNNLWNFVRKIRNKVARATKLGSDALLDDVIITKKNPGYSVGQLCDASGITKEWLQNPIPMTVQLTNKHVLELMEYKNSCGAVFTYENASCWVQKLCGLPLAPNEHTLRSNWMHLKKQHGKLATKPQIQKIFHQERYQPPSPPSEASGDGSSDGDLIHIIGKLEKKMDELHSAYTVQLTKIKTLNKDNQSLISSKQEALKQKRELAHENHRLNKTLADLQDCNDYLLKELSTLDKENAKKTITRRETQLERCREQLKESEEEAAKLRELNEDLNTKLERVTAQLERDKKRLSDKVHYYKSKSRRLSDITHNEKLMRDYQKEIRDLKDTNKELQENLNEVTQTPEVTSFHGGKYTDEVRMVCYELLSCGVGTNHVSEVIRTVLTNLAGVNIGRLPKPTILKYMATQSGLLAKAAAVSAIEKSAGFTTLHSDGTSRQNQGMRRKYLNYLVSTDSGLVATGLQEQHSADTTAQVQGTNDMFSDILQIHNDNEEKGKRLNSLIMKNKNLMQDRSSVMKSFAEQYEAWRADVLPALVQNWDDMENASKEDLCRVNDAYCLAHPILTLQDVADKAINEWEKIETEGRKIGREKNTLWKRKESATLCAVRSMCVAFGSEADEAAGHPNQFLGHLQGRKCELQGFRGNRFNSPFVNSTASYYHHGDALGYISTLTANKNLLLRCVEDDLKDDVIVIGMRTMGLIETQITTPYMKLVASNIPFTDVGPSMTALRDHLARWSKDPSDLLNGSAALFPEFPPVRDHLYRKLFDEVPQHIEEGTHVLLGIVSAAMLGVVERQLSDHLPGGRFHTPTQSIREEMSTTPLDNLSAERLFASLDRLQKRMPNANTITMEGMLLWTQNKTGAYLRSLPDREREELMASARKKTPTVLRAYQARKMEIKQHYRDLQSQREVQKNQKILREAEQKDQIAEVVSTEGGLCKTEEEVDNRLHGMADTEKRSFLAHQIKYHKILHSLPGIDKSYFFQQTKGTKLPVEDLITNLKKIIAFRKNLSSPTPDRQSSVTSIDSHSSKIQQFMTLKRKFLEKADENRQTASQQKRRKATPFPAEIIGKRIRHLWTIDGKETWCKGTVLRLSNEDDLQDIDDDDRKFLGQEQFFTIAYDLWKGEEFSYPLKREWKDGCVDLI